MQQVGNTFLVVLCFSIFGFTSHAQKNAKPKITWGKDVKSNAYSYTYYCGENEENHYVLDLNFQVLGKGGAEFHAYPKSKNGNQKTVAISEEGATRFDMASLGAVVIGGTPYVYERQWDVKKKCYEIKLTEVDVNSLERTNNTETINSLDKNKNKKNDVVFSQIAHSQNGEYTAIYSSSSKGFNLSEYARVYPGISLVMMLFNRSANFYIRTHSVTVFDNRANEVWSKTFLMGAKKNYVTMSEIGITDKGDVYFFGDEYNTKSMLSSMEYAYNYASKYTNIYTLTSRDETPNHIEVKWDDGWSTENAYYFENGSFFCAGSIMKKSGKKDYFYGIGIQEITFDGEVRRKLEMPMDISYFGKELTKRQEKKLKKGKSVTPSIGMPLIHYVRLTEDGGFIVCAEERILHEKTTTTTNTSTGSSTSRTDYDYEFKNAVVFKVSATGESEWKQVIEKNQYLNSMYWQGSVFVAEVDNSLLLAFNDEIAKDKTYNSSNKPKFIHLVKVSETGEIEMDKKVKGNSSPIAPVFCRQQGEQILLMGHNTKVRCFGIYVP